MCTAARTPQYAYYGLTSLGVNFGRKKRYITKMQLIQFVVLVIVGAHVLLHPECGFPSWLLYTYIPYMVGFFLLFSHFYWKAFKASRAARAASAKASKPAAAVTDTSPAQTRSRAARKSKKTQ